MLLLLISFALNVVFLLGYTGAISDPLSEDPEGVDERFYLGDPNARDKIAVVRVSGVITESGIAYPIRQLRAAAADKRVKAVVLRDRQPRRNGQRQRRAVPVHREPPRQHRPAVRGHRAQAGVGVDGSRSPTSGGYYIATAGNPIVAEKTTITGSIGVFAALPNVADWAKEHGVKLELVKAGGHQGERVVLPHARPGGAADVAGHGR